MADLIPLPAAVALRNFATLPLRPSVPIVPSEGDLMLSWPRRRPPEYECVHGITWPTASSAAYCDCEAGFDDAA